MESKRNLKIGIDIRTLMDEKYSGVSLYTLDLIREILKEDERNEYILFYNSWKNIKNNIPEFKGNVKIVNTKFPNKLFNYFFQKIFKYPKIDKVLGGVDIFFSPHMNFSSLSSSVKNILTIHDLSFLRYPDFFSSRKNFWHYSLGIKDITSKADKIVAVSENTKNDIIKFLSIDEKKINVIQSAISKKYKIVEKSDENLKNVKHKYELPDKFILFLSTIEPRKNITGLMEAFDKIADREDLKDYQLIIAGAVGWKSKNIFEFHKKLKSKNRIRFIGYIPENEKRYLYNLADIFAYPSFYEGFGFPPLEAMACGCPVISSANSSISDLTRGSALLIDPNNSESIASAILNLVKDSELKSKLVQKGLKRAGEFNWGKTASEYIKLFESFLSYE